MNALPVLPLRLRPAAAALLVALGLACLPGQTQPVRSSEPVTLNFVGAEIEAVARTMATITGRNVVVDPRVQGQITLSTDRPVTPAAAVNQFAAALRLQGFSLVDTGGLYKVVPEADAKLMGSVVVGAGGPGAAPNTVVTQIFRLNHESANNLVPVLRPLIGPNNTINVNPGNNSLVITDYADNLQRIGRIIASLDVAGATDIEIIPLQHAVAADLVPLVQRLIEPGGNTGSGGGNAGRRQLPHHHRGRAAQQQPGAAGRQPGPAGAGALAGDPAGPAYRRRAGGGQHPCGLPQERQCGGAGRHAAGGHLG